MFVSQVAGRKQWTVCTPRLAALEPPVEERAVAPSPAARAEMHLQRLQKTSECTFYSEAEVHNQMDCVSAAYSSSFFFFVLSSMSSS